MILGSLIFVSGVLFACGNVLPADHINEDALQDIALGVPQIKLKTTCDLIERHNIRCEKHIVTNKFGYQLELHRIPYNSKKNQEYKGVVFLMHGLQASSADWVVLGPEKGLAFVLADRGYDVWMGNDRGNKYSRKHVSLNPDTSKAYWDFSWHELGVVDLPAMIDYVLEKTGQSQLTYFGHSQGTTSFFVMTSELPEYNKKIKMMHAFAPVTYMKHSDNLFLKVVSRTMKSPVVYKLLGDGEFIPSNDFISKFGAIICRDRTLTQAICKNIHFLLVGYDPSNLNKTILPDIMQNVPAGCSTRQILHFAQETNYGLLKIGKTPKFLKYDFGSMENTKRYGQQTPPEYDLKKVTCKVALYVGENDKLASPKDVKYLSTKLSNVVSYYTVPHNKWIHADFVWGKNVDSMLYVKMFQVMDEYVE